MMKDGWGKISSHVNAGAQDCMNNDKVEESIVMQMAENVSAGISCALA